MSNIYLKQFDTAPLIEGSIPVVDDSIAKWSEDSTGAILLPTGNTTTRPTGVNGYLRYNSQNNKFEAYENGNWKNIISGLSVQDEGSGIGATNGITSLNFVGSGVTVTGSGGNATVTIPGGSASLQVFTFVVQMTGTNPTSIIGTPSGWTIDIVTTDDIKLTHNLAKQPIGGVVYGKQSSGLWITRAFGAAASTLTIEYDENDNDNITYLKNVTTTNTSAASGSQAKIVLYFL